MRKSNKQILTEIKYLFFKVGSESYFGEKVSQFEHASQAMMLAMSDDEPVELQVAAFLHDIGHMLESKEESMEIYGRKDHEEAAAAWLAERGFSERVQATVKNHVDAKRYLCFKNPEYYDGLSKASKKTLGFQGGVMTALEAERFENDRFFEDSLKLRFWDDKAKVQNIQLPTLDECLEIVDKYLSKNVVQ
jgi:2-amino-1-hydroxyethylphosphonate dioxygenase (glycine-forming)